MLIGCLLHTPAPWILSPQLVMCPNLEWNWQHFGAQNDAQPTEPHWPMQALQS